MRWIIFYRSRASALGAAILALLAVLFLVDPAHTDIFPPCPFRLATGLYCPGCGSLRACHRLLRADIGGAFSMNPLMVCTLPALGLLLWRRCWTYKRWLAWLASVTLMAYGIARNIQSWPFTLLAPQ